MAMMMTAITMREGDGKEEGDSRQGNNAPAVHEHDNEDRVPSYPMPPISTPLHLQLILL